MASSNDDSTDHLLVQILDSDDGDEQQPATKKSKQYHQPDSKTASLMRGDDDRDTRFEFVGYALITPPPWGLGDAISEVLAVSRYNNVDLDSVLANSTKAGVEEEMKDLLECLATTSTSSVEFGEGEWVSEHSIKVNSMLLGKSSQCQQRRRIMWEQLPLHVEPLPFLGIITNLASLQELNVRIAAGNYYCNRVRLSRERDDIAKAFQSNRTLQKLVLCVMGDQDTFTAILAALYEHPTLRELHCKRRDDENVDVAAISDYLACPTCKLERLSISSINWTRSDMAQLLPGLQRAPVAAGGLPTTLLRSLRLDHCRLGKNEEALEELFAFLETPTIYESSLNELSLVGTYFGDDLSIRLAASLMTAAAAATADQDANTSVSTPTIGSQIQTFCLDLNRHSRGFLRHLADNAQRVHLQTLELQSLDGAGVACFTHLPKLWSLRKLRLLKLDGSQRDLYWIVRGLKDNVSILVVETSGNDVPPCMAGKQFSAAQQRLIDAYGQRNQHWNALIGTSSAAVAKNDTVGTETGTGTTGVTAASTTETQGAAAADLCLGSSLLQCVQQLPPTRTTMLSRGLRALGLRIDDQASNDNDDNEPRTMA